MSNEILCEKCGSPMRPLDPQKPIGMTCDKCGWGWATTYIEPILTDTSKYSLSIHRISNPDAKVLRILANICNCNYVQAKEQISNHDIVISDCATSIKEFASMLNKHGIQFDISPEFPYEIN